MFPDILASIAAKHGWELQYVPGTWSQCLERLESGEIDIMVDVAYSEERAKKYLFNDESLLTNWGVIYTSADVYVHGIEDLKGLRVAVMKNSIHTVSEEGILALLAKFSITPSQYIEFQSYKDVFIALDTGQADVGIVNRIFGSVNEALYNVVKTSIIFNPRQLYFAFPLQAKRSKELKKVIDEELRILKRNKYSAYHNALDRYLSVRAMAPSHEAQGAGGPEVALTDEERAWIREHPVIRFAVDPEFVPFEFLEEDGSYHGIASDYVKLLSERLGITFERISTKDWAEAVEMARNGRVDVLPCVGRTGDRKNFLLFTRPYAQFQRVIVTRADAPFITGLEDIASLRVAVQVNTSHEGFLRENTEIEPLLSETLKEALLAVSNGKADAMVGNLAAAAYWIRKLNLTNLKIAAPAGTEELNLHFGVRSDWPEFVRILNKGLVTITPQEEQTIMQRWVGVEFKTGIDPTVVRKYVVNITAVVLLVLAVILFWNYRLKREVAKRRVVEAKLRYSGELKNLLSEISTDFVNLEYPDFDNGLRQAMEKVCRMVEGDGAYLCEKNENKSWSCDRYWESGLSGRGVRDLFASPTDAETLWLSKELLAGKVVAVDSVSAMESGMVPNSRDIAGRGVGAFIELPLKYGREIKGLLSIVCKGDGREWTSDEKDFLQITGQVFTNVFMRRDYESSLHTRSQELQEANRKLKDLDKLKSMFIASMSHELRTPLNSIIGFTGVILSGMSGELSDTQKDQLGRVYNASKHLLALITDVIDISKIEAGRVDVYVEEFNLRNVVNEALTTVEQQVKIKGLAVNMAMDEEVIMRSDRKRVLQCLINFISNAVKYSEKGEITIQVELSEDMVDISVSDTGIGISEDDLPRLFEAFERFESHLKVKAGGTGLGLYLTRKLVQDLLGGDVRVKSELGRGSTFGLRIPMDLETVEKGGNPNGMEEEA